LLCPPGDPAALAERIGALLGDPARRQSMSESSRQRWEQNFTLDAMLDATAVVYEDVLAGRARAKSS
jgi:glycosyltransferase involved in cell wall biosynthesis